MGTGEDGDENYNRMKNSRAWAQWVRWTTKKGGGAAYTQGIFLHTLVHTPRYSTCKNICYSHTRPLQVPREPVAAAGGLGWADGHLLNIHSKVYVHMYTYVQTPSPAPGGRDEGAGQGQTPPWKPLGSPKCSFAKERGWSMVTVVSPRAPRTSTFLSAQRPVRPDTAWAGGGHVICARDNCV